MKRARNTLVMAALCAVIAFPAFAHHLESNNRLTFAPVMNSSSPDASGMGNVNFDKGASGGSDATAVFNIAFAFMGLEPNMPYTVAVQGAFSTDPSVYGGLCSFVTNANGNGNCENQLVGLLRLQVAQLRVGNVNGTPVLQATRPGFGSGPGLIESRGGCRVSGGVTCDAPGRQ